jgi:hypothetical protein
VIQKGSTVAARLLLSLDRLFALAFGLNGMARQYGERADDHAERTGSEPQDVGHRAQAGATMVPEVGGYHRDPPFRRFTPAIPATTTPMGEPRFPRFAPATHFFAGELREQRLIPWKTPRTYVLFLFFPSYHEDTARGAS